MSTRLSPQVARQPLRSGYDPAEVKRRAQRYANEHRVPLTVCYVRSSRQDHWSIQRHADDAALAAFRANPNGMVIEAVIIPA